MTGVQTCALPICDLVSDEIVIELVKERLARPDAQSGFVLDGFPRTGEQARALDELLAAAGREPVRVVCLEVPEEELIRRIMSRRSEERRVGKESRSRWAPYH